MDDGLVQNQKIMLDLKKKVLILIVVDNGLVLIIQKMIGRIYFRLNPYCSGQWSRTWSKNQNKS